MSEDNDKTGYGIMVGSDHILRLMERMDEKLNDLAGKLNDLHSTQIEMKGVHNANAEKIKELQSVVAKIDDHNIRIDRIEQLQRWVIFGGGAVLALIAGFDTVKHWFTGKP